MSDPRETRQSLLLELGRRSGDAWTEFLAVYEGAIYRAARARGLQDADARDVTQDVLAAVHERVVGGGHDPARGSFRAWLMRVTRNVSVDLLARHGRGGERASGSTGVERALNEVPAPEDARDTAFDLEVRRAVFSWAATRVRGEVRDVTWRAFHLTAVQGLSADDAAARLGVAVGSVYTAKCRVVARIRARAAEFEPEV